MNPGDNEPPKKENLNEPSEADHPAMGGMMREYARTGGPGDDEGFLARVRRATGIGGGAGEEDWPWLFSGFFWKVAAAALVMFTAFTGVRTWMIYHGKADPTEVFVFTQPRITPGQIAAVRVMVRDARNHIPVPNARVHVMMAGANVNKRLGTVQTDEEGIADVTAEVSDTLKEGDYTISVEVSGKSGHAHAEQTVTFERTYRTMLSTDKPLYQPGQIIHMRALSLETDSMSPAADREVVFEVRDAKGNKVFAKKTETSAFGIASADFQLANQVNTGEYSLAVTVGDTTSERAVTVDRYTLPKYRIDLSADRSYYKPGDTMSVSLDANYTFGKPVGAADVTIRAEEFIERFRAFETVKGKTNENGRFDFQLPLKDAFVGQPLNQGNAFVRLNAEVTDATGETRNQTLEVKVTNNTILVELFPESGELVQGVENVLYVMTAYPDGSPAETTIFTGGGTKVVTNELGIGKMKLTPNKPNLKLTLSARDSRNQQTRVEKVLTVGAQKEGVLLRVEKALYSQGETAQLTVLSASAARRVFVDVVRNGRSFLTTAVDLQGGQGTYALDLPPDVVGSLQLQAYAILKDGEIARDTKLIQVQRADQLKVTAKLNAETYRPAEEAMIDFLVTSKEGDPVEAALSLSAVDEAVFALNDARPGLEEMYFLIQEEILKPRFQLVRPPMVDFTQVPDETNEELEEANVVAFAAVGGGGAPVQTAGAKLAEREQQVREERRAKRHSLIRLLADLPFTLFAIFGGLFLFYSVSRVKVDPSGTEAQIQVDAFKRRMVHLCVILILAVVTTPVAIAVMGSMDIIRDELMLTMMVVAITVAWDGGARHQGK